MYVHNCIIIFNITEIFLLGVIVSQFIIDTEELSKGSTPSSSLELDWTGSNKDTLSTSILLKGH